MEKLSDERLRNLAESSTDSLGPVMPETLGDGLLRHIVEAGRNYFGEEHMTSMDRAKRAWSAIRAALMKESMGL